MLTRRKPHFPRPFPNRTVSYSPGTLSISWTFEAPDIFIFYSVTQMTKGLVKPLASGSLGQSLLTLGDLHLQSQGCREPQKGLT